MTTPSIYKSPAGEKEIMALYDWAGPGYAEWLEDVLDGLGAQKAALLGLAQGGWAALRFATYRPERVDRLVLLLGGTEDAIRPVEAAVARMERLVPKVQAMLIPNMGHVLVNMPERILPFLMAPAS